MPRDRDAAISIALLAALIFLPTALFCGLYLDDYSFLQMLESASPRSLWIEFLHYVPGRNLHIPLFYLLLRLTGGSVAAMHAASVAFDALNAALVFTLVRRLTGLRSVAWAAAAMFIVAPNHGETHFWITLIPQCQIPTSLLLAAFLLAASPGGPRLAAAAAVYAAALFTYDQVFFLWPLLLAVAWSREAGPGLKRLAAAAAAFLAMNAAHISLRYLSPYASGGRPLIRVSDFFRRCYDAAMSVGKGVVPWPTASHARWWWTVLAAAAAIAAGLWLVRAAKADARAESRELARWTEETGWLKAAAFGLAWAALAYAPNLFWYISPRHNLLPSIGWCLSLAALGAAVAARGGRPAAALPWAAIVFFALAAVSDVHEGTQWVDSRLLRDAFAEEVRRLEPPVESLFLIGAPRYLRRAPAFNLPHDVVLAGGRALGRPSLQEGDYEAAPTRNGVVYINDLSVAAPTSFRWLPADKVNLLSYDRATRAFSCAASLDLESPDGSRFNLPLRSGAGCAAKVAVPLDAALTDIRTLPRTSSTDTAPRAAGLALLRAEVVVRGGATRLRLEWSVQSPPSATLAYVPTLKGASGSRILDSIFAAGDGKRPYPMLWPLVDDQAPRAGLKPGQGLIETFELRRVPAGQDSNGSLELDVFELAPGSATRPAGRISVPVAIQRRQTSLANLVD